MRQATHVKSARARAWERVAARARQAVEEKGVTGAAWVLLNPIFEDTVRARPPAPVRRRRGVNE